MNDIKEYIAELIAECLNNKYGIDEIKKCSDLRSIGFSSLNAIEVVTEIESKYDVEFAEEILSIENLSSVDDIYSAYLLCLSNEEERVNAWNLVGGLFWQEGRVSARPNDNDIESFLSGAENKKIAVIGASTKYLIEKAATISSNVYVLDFSEKMISDLKEVLGDKCSYIKYDILKGERLDQKFDLIISDRLVNRFTYWEAVNVIKNSIAMLEKNGVVKHAIKLGNYELDNRLIAYAKENGLALDFWDEETKTIDYTKTKDFLFGCIKEHGNISKDILYKWYLGRGRESRFDHKDIVDIVNSADGKLVSDDNYEANAETRIFCISRR